MSPFAAAGLVGVNAACPRPVVETGRLGAGHAAIKRGLMTGHLKKSKVTNPHAN
jgi:hypothetical protein